MQCEGWQRTGGAFSFGPVKWEQCEEEATVMLTSVQQKVESTLPACQKYWTEAIERGIEIKTAMPLNNMYDFFYPETNKRAGLGGPYASIDDTKATLLISWMEIDAPAEQDLAAFLNEKTGDIIVLREV